MTTNRGGGGSGVPTGPGNMGSGTPEKPKRDGKDGAGGGGAGVVSCVPGVQSTIVTDCGYPSASASPLTSVVFNESDVLRLIQPAGSAPTGIVKVFYNDEHALTLGVRQVVVKSATGTTSRDYPVSPLLTSPGSATSPLTGSNELVGNTTGLDAALRPMWPALFFTDITADPSSRAGDWQQGGRPRGPDAVFGTWKAAVRTVDTTVTPNAVSITPDADPAKNSWNLPGGDPVPAGLTDEGFGAEARWNVGLSPGHSYRIQVIVHDGDQSKAGGDTGEACVVFCAGGGGSEGGGTGGSSPPPACPSGLRSCADVIDTGSCPAGSVCANGCCLPQIIVP